MITKILIPFLFILFFSCTGTDKDQIYELRSPNGVNTIKFELKNSAPFYSVLHKDTTVISPSLLGFVFKNRDTLSHNFEIIKIDTTSVDETWEQVWGEKRFIKNNYRQLSATLQEITGEKKRKLEIQFRAFDDGIAFRYIFPDQGIKDSIFIMDELTEFNLKSDGEAWWIPAYQDNRYEYLFTKSAVSVLDTVHTPLTIKSNNGLYLSFHEANLKDFASTTIDPNIWNSIEV
ncbi:MAG: glycoside hydrolase family 97 N-terminal domain-containing protein [Flavobacteriaceae bacterium]|nr:glycoside hydrolase family 97 N-terminal domain-containing protein [Flavobacteriaceae bacterium]